MGPVCLLPLLATVAALEMAPGTCASAWHADAADVQRPAPAARAPLDAAVFFESLAERYRRLIRYADRVDLVQVYSGGGDAAPHEIDTQLTCVVDRDELRVTTPARQALAATGLDALRQSEGMRAARRRYDLWLAPHLALKFLDQPLRDFRAGIDEGFTPTGAGRVTLDDRPLVHVRLESGTGSSAPPRAAFDLYVNPESMLIERIEGEQALPDGARLKTSLKIRTLEAECDAVAQTGDGDRHGGGGSGGPCAAAPEATDDDGAEAGAPIVVMPQRARGVAPAPAPSGTSDPIPPPPADPPRTPEPAGSSPLPATPPAQQGGAPAGRPM